MLIMQILPLLLGPALLGCCIQHAKLLENVRNLDLFEDVAQGFGLQPLRSVLLKATNMESFWEHRL